MLLQHSEGFPLGYIREGLYQLVIRLIVLPVGYKVLGLVFREVLGGGFFGFFVGFLFFLLNVGGVFYGCGGFGGFVLKYC